MRRGSNLFSFVGYTGREVQNKIQVYLRGENCPADTTLIDKSLVVIWNHKREENTQGQSKKIKREASGRTLRNTTFNIWGDWKELTKKLRRKTFKNGRVNKIK